MITMKAVKTMFGSLSILLLGLMIFLGSCNNESDNSPVTPSVDGDGAANFYAIRADSCEKPYGGYYRGGGSRILPQNL